MTKKEFIAAVAEQTGVAKKDAERVYDAIFAGIAEQMAAGEKVSVNGFGTFEVRERAARQGLNPLTKEKIEIAACKVPAFKAAKALKDSVNK